MLNRYVIVELYTDRVPPVVMQPATTPKENKKLQDERFQDDRLPLYVILRPDGKDGEEIARYDEGKINNAEAFAEFLRRPLTTNGSGTQVGMR